MRHLTQSVETENIQYGKIDIDHIDAYVLNSSETLRLMDAIYHTIIEGNLSFVFALNNKINLNYITAEDRIVVSGEEIGTGVMTQPLATMSGIHIERKGIQEIITQIDTITKHDNRLQITFTATE